MKNSIKLAILGLLGTLAFTNLSSVQANEISVNDNVKALLTEYYNKGVYKKTTEIYLSPEAVDELQIYFHAGSTELKRTTYYDGNQLWMSRKNGTYAYYGTDAEGNLTSATTQEALSVPEKASLAVTKGNNTDSQTWDTEDVGMEGYYVTLKDISEDFFDEVTWTYENGVYATDASKVIDYFRLFTAPCFLSVSEKNMNYITFTKVTVEELYGTLELKLYAEGTESGKLTSSSGIFSSATVVKDFQTSLGTELEPYAINTQADFDNFKAKAAAGSTFEGKYIELNTDVTLDEILNKTSATQFAGVFDGNNHVITLNIEGADHVAAFGYLAKTGEIKNVVLEGTVNATDEKAGGLVATCYGVVRDCENRATITSTSYEVGGLVGYLCIGAKIYDSVNNGNVIGGTKVGGIAGFTGGNSIVENCKNMSAIEGDYSVGGIVGVASQSLRISRNVNEGSVVGKTVATGKGTGGIVGDTDKNVKITYCENKGTVTVSEGYNAGGIVGVIGNNDTTPTVVDGCTNSGNITAGRIIGGIVANNQGGVIFNCSNSGTIYGTTPDDSFNFNLGGIVGKSTTSLKDTATFTIRKYTSVTEYEELTEQELTGTIINCSNSGKVYADPEITTQQKIGGIVGYLNDGSNTGILTACYNSGEVIGTKQTGGIIGISQTSTEAASSKYCYQLGSTVKFLNGTVATSRYSSQNNVCTLLGYRSGATTANICIDLSSSAENGLCQAFKS